MEKQENDNELVETVICAEKPVWRKPELTVISVSETKSGTFSPGLSEGTFYSPS